MGLMNPTALEQCALTLLSTAAVPQDSQAPLLAFLLAVASRVQDVLQDRPQNHPLLLSRLLATINRRCGDSAVNAHTKEKAVERLVGVCRVKDGSIL